MKKTILALAAMAPAASALACATCGCTLSTDAAMGYSAAKGWRLSLEFDYIDQSQLRNGRSAVPASQAAAVNSAGGSQEVERQTINRYTTLGISYHPDADWGVTMRIPYIDRSHTTYGSATPDQLTPANVSASTTAGLGDAKLIGSYQGFLPTHNLGVQLGVKLPTGRYGGQNVITGETVGRNPVFFSSGPNAAAGLALDTSLQAGTGSTDIIVGAYYYQAISRDFDVTANVQFQAAVAEKLDQRDADFRPGDLATVSVGLRYEADPRWVPQLQINVSHKSLDQGALADTLNTAGTVVYLSPGVTVSLQKTLQLYGFVQLPVYSQLQGYQLFPRWTASLGASYAF